VNRQLPGTKALGPPPKEMPILKNLTSENAAFPPKTIHLAYRVFGGEMVVHWWSNGGFEKKERLTRRSGVRFLIITAQSGHPSNF
jgi:hypothetical protein